MLKYLTLNTCIRKEERDKISDLNIHLKKPEKEEQIKAKVSRRKELINKNRNRRNDQGNQKQAF